MRLQMIAAILAVGAISMPCAAEELNLEQVLEKHYEAIGGQDTWLAVKTLRISGTMKSGPMETPFVLMNKRPNKMRMEFTVQGTTGIQAYDGENGWLLMPFLGKTEPERVQADQANQMKQQADLDGLFIGYKEAGHTLELMGQEEIEGVGTYVIKVILEDDSVRMVYLDATSFVEIRIDGTTDVQGDEFTIETSLGNYQEVAGLNFPYLIESKAKGQPSGQVMTIEKVEVNPELGDDLFVMPKPTKAPESEMMSPPPTPSS